MEWHSEGAILSMRPHGESAAIIEVFTALHGRHAGVVRGGTSRRMAAHLQPGTQVAVTWRARLGEHMGGFTCEPIRARAGILGDALALAGLNSVCALCQIALPEREGMGGFYTQTIALLDALEAGADWPPDYMRWEQALLDALGYGLDLTRCAVTGGREDLAYVSPKSGRAVARGAAGEWADRLLPLPQAMLGQGPAAASEVLQGLAITGHFLARGLDAVLNGRPMPQARTRLLARLEGRASQMI
ncbi:MAG: DNA repair protein RecO [Cypionkella sp.]|nr:DNA repair protein RecO [Cypionkella sp.]